MGLRDSFVNLFKENYTPPNNPGGTQQLPNQQQQNQPGNKQIPPDGSTQLEQSKKPGAQEQQNREQQTSPLDQFKDLWKDDPTDPGKQTGNEQQKQNQSQQQQNQQQQQGNKYTEIAKKIDFSRLIPADLMQKAISGDVGAFGQVINTVTQASFAAAMRMADQQAQQHVKSFETRFGESLPGKFKEFSLSNTSFKNSALQHPAVKPLVDAVRLQMAQKFPDATTAELQEKAEQYIEATFGEVNKVNSTTSAQQQQTSADSRQEVIKAQEENRFDWESFYGMPKPS